MRNNNAKIIPACFMGVIEPTFSVFVRKENIYDVTVVMV